MSLASYKMPGIPDDLLVQARSGNPGASPAEIQMIAARELKAKNLSDKIVSGDAKPGSGSESADGGYTDITLGTANFSARGIMQATQQSLTFFASKDSAFYVNGLDASNNVGAKNAAKVSVSSAMAAVALDEEANPSAKSGNDDVALQQKTEKTNKAINDLAKNDPNFKAHVKLGLLADEDHAKILKALHAENPNYKPTAHEIAKMREAAHARGLESAPAGMNNFPSRNRSNINLAMHGGYVKEIAPELSPDPAPKASSKVAMKSDDALDQYAKKRKLLQPGAGA